MRKLFIIISKLASLASLTAGMLELVEVLHHFWPMVEFILLATALVITQALKISAFLFHNFNVRFLLEIFRTRCAVTLWTVYGISLLVSAFNFTCKCLSSPEPIVIIAFAFLYAMVFVYDFIETKALISKIKSLT